MLPVFGSFYSAKKEQGFDYQLVFDYLFLILMIVCTWAFAIQTKSVSKSACLSLSMHLVLPGLPELLFI